MSANLAATVAALKDGDRVRATFVDDGITTTIEGPARVSADGRSMEVSVGQAFVRHWDGQPHATLTAVEVLAPALPPEPPIGSGVFHDGVLWQGSSNGYWTAYILGAWVYRRWADLQPCVPAVPQEPEVRAEPVGLSTDEPNGPFGSVAVFRTKDGMIDVIHKWDNGLWGGAEWNRWVGHYGAPVAVIPAGGE